MDEHENFEDRLRAMADEISRSLQRMSEVDLDDLAERYGLDVDRARTFADAAGKWLSDRLPRGRGAPAGGKPADPDVAEPRPGLEKAPAASGPHPLDLPTDAQGLALSAL